MSLVRVAPDVWVESTAVVAVEPSLAVEHECWVWLGERSDALRVPAFAADVVEALQRVQEGYDVINGRGAVVARVGFDRD